MIKSSQNKQTNKQRKSRYQQNQCKKFIYYIVQKVSIDIYIYRVF